MSGTHFYLTLPSNASMDVFPNNKIGSYHVKLPQAVDLHSDWEGGLYSISYPNTKHKARFGIFRQIVKNARFGGEDTKLLKTTEGPFVAVSFSRKSSETQTSIYFEPFLLAESRVMSLRKHLLTFSTCPCRQSLSKTSKSF